MKTPFKRILAAIDRSASANNVFDLAIAQIKRNCKHLMLTDCLSLKQNLFSSTKNYVLNDALCSVMLVQTINKIKALS